MNLKMYLSAAPKSLRWHKKNKFNEQKSSFGISQKGTQI